MESAVAKTQTVKISSKRQITIPAKWYKEIQFDEYALCTWTDEGILIQPIQSEDEDITVDILRHLIEQGYEGEELLEKYQEAMPRVIKITEKIDEAEADITDGRVVSFDDMQTRAKKSYEV